MHAILCHTLGPYHRARYTALSRIRNDFIVIEFASEQNSHSWKSERRDLPFRRILLHDGSREDLSAGTYTKRVINILDNIQPTSVLSLSYNEPYMRAATIWARKHEAISIMISETWQGDKRRYIFFEALKSIWCRWAYDGAFVSGIRTAQYYQQLGIPEQKIWMRCDVVDNSHFSEEAKNAHENCGKIRELLNLPEKYFLAVCRFVPEKNLPRLLHAYKTYLMNNGDWDLVIIGGGPQEQLIKDLSLELSTKIHILGWKENSELPLYYGLAKGFILPSVSEPWGLVVNEAMASNLPVLVSSKCGCKPELCLSGVNGFEFNPYDSDEITSVLLKLSSLSDDRLDCMAKNSKAIIHNYSPEFMAASLSDCLDALSN